MAGGQEFRLTGDHLALLRAARVVWDRGWWGGPRVCGRTPFGRANGTDVPAAVARVLGWEWVGGGAGVPPRLAERAWELHAELLPALQILCQLAGSEVGPGLWRRAADGTWGRVGD